MPITLKIPPETDSILKALARMEGKTKATLILEALKEKYSFKKKRRELIKNSAGWMSPDEAAELRNSVAVFDLVDEKDWP